MSAGYVYIPYTLSALKVYKVVIHIGVGFCVARSDYGGQCEGLKQRDE
jgi:hypothetical protein